MDKRLRSSQKSQLEDPTKNCSIRLDAETIAEKHLSEKTFMNPISGVNYPEI